MPRPHGYLSWFRWLWQREFDGASDALGFGSFRHGNNLFRMYGHQCAGLAQLPEGLRV